MIEKSLIEKYGYFMSVHEVADFLKISPQTIYNRMSQRRFEIAAVKGAKQLRFKTTDVAKYYDSIAA